MIISTEERLDLGYDLGTVSTIKQRGNRMPKLTTGVVQNLDDFGFYRSWAIGSRNISREKIGKLVAFYLARGGTLQRFRYKDWADFHALHDSVTESGYLGVGDATTVQFQLIKRYGDDAFGLLLDAAGTQILEVNGDLITTTELGDDIYVRKITKPVAGSVAVYFDGIVQASGWSVDTTTGLVTFAVAPALDVDITADFEFDVPARFTSRDFSTKFLAYRDRGVSIHNLPALELMEV